MKMTPLIYQIKITLEGVQPEIWRRLFIQGDLFMHDFHKIIQTTMGWENIHLHQFLKNDRIFGIADNEPESPELFMDYTSIRVMDLLKAEGDTLRYLYDFGDSWIHKIDLEIIEPYDQDLFYPVCIDGERACPPEDCGGIPGYNDLTLIMAHPGHPRRDEMEEWLGDDYDPEEFDADTVNSYLLEDDFGCLPYLD
jgi:hypothetical protein